MPHADSSLSANALVTTVSNSPLPAASAPSVTPFADWIADSTQTAADWMSSRLSDWSSDWTLKNRDNLDQSGFMFAPIIKVVVQFPDKTKSNARIQLYFELTKKDPITGHRKFIVTWSAGTTVRNPLGLGSYSGRYSWSTDPVRQGYNQVFQYTVKGKGGVGLEDSTTQGQFFSIWKEEGLGIGIGDELFRLDCVASLGKWFKWARPHTYLSELLTQSQGGISATTFDVMAGADFVIYSPGLNEIPGFKHVGQAVNSLFRIRERVKNNRANYAHETNLTEIVNSMFSDTRQGPLHASGGKHSYDSGPPAPATPAQNHIEMPTPKTIPAGMLTP